MCVFYTRLSIYTRDFLIDTGKKLETVPDIYCVAYSMDLHELEFFFIFFLHTDSVLD
jgi:hypothetical protein